VKKKILISGSYGTGNVGDEVILERLLSLLKGHDITVLSQGTDYTTKHFSNINVLPQTPSWKLLRIIKDTIKLRFSLLKNRINFLKALIDADIFLVGGGGLFAEMVPQVLEFYLHQIKWANFFKTKTIVFGVGIGPLLTNAGKVNLKKTFNKCVSGCLVRDLQSFNNLSSVGLGDKATVGPDLAFLGDYQNKRSEGAGSDRERVVINIYPVFGDASIWDNAEARHESFVKTIKGTINYLLGNNYKVELLPFGTKSDLAFSRKIAAFFPTNVTVFEGSNYKAIQERFSGALFSITMRFHAGVLSFLHGVPSLCIDQQFKSERLLADMKLEELLLCLPDGFHKPGNKDLNLNEIISAIEALINEREHVLKIVEAYFLTKKGEAQLITRDFLFREGLVEGGL